MLDIRDMEAALTLLRETVLALQTADLAFVPASQA